MTIDVLAPSYDSAAQALIDVNHDAATLYIDLKGALAGSGSMAGDDSTSTDFATAYDENAQAAVDALCDLVDAAGNLGVLTAMSIGNHRQGEAAAAYTAPPLVFDGCLIPAGTGELDVEGFAVPTSLGGDGGDLPQFLDIVIDHVQGVVWPNADIGKLRDAAAAWRTAAGALDLLDAGCQSALDLLAAQRSPEISLALNAVRELKTCASDLADACRSLASACDDYAGQVDHHREEIKDLLKQLAIEAGVTAVVGGVLSFVSFGLTGAAATAAIAARAATFGARIIGVLNKLRTAIRIGALVKLGAVGTKIKKAGPILKRLRNRTSRTPDKPPKLPKRKPDEIRDSLPPGKNKGVHVVRSERELRDLWAELKQDGELIPGRGGGKYEGWYRLPDGTEVGLRTTSKSGGPTIDIRVPGSSGWKIHIDE